MVYTSSVLIEIYTLTNITTFIHSVLYSTTDLKYTRNNHILYIWLFPTNIQKASGLLLLLTSPTFLIYPLKSSNLILISDDPSSQVPILIFSLTMIILNTFCISFNWKHQCTYLHVHICIIEAIKLPNIPPLFKDFLCALPDRICLVRQVFAKKEWIYLAVHIYKFPTWLNTSILKACTIVSVLPRYWF